MRYYGNITDPKDLVTKEYVDEQGQGQGSNITGKLVKGIAQNQISIGNIVYNVNTAIPEEPIYSDAENTEFSSNFYTKAVFNKAGTLMVLTGTFPGYAKLYSVSGLDMTYITDIYADNDQTPLSAQARCAVFSPDGALLVVGGLFSDYAKVYSVSGTTLTFLMNLPENAAGTAISKYIMSADINKDGTLLVIGGYHNAKVLAYTIDGQTVSFLKELTTSTGQCTMVRFTPDGEYLFANTSQDYYLWYFKVTGQSIGTNKAFASKTTFNGAVHDIAFSRDMKKLIICGSFSFYARYYAVSYDQYGNISFSYQSDLMANSATTRLDAMACSAEFSPDDRIVVLGGSFKNKVKVYTVGSNSIDYAADIPLDNTVWGTSFDPDGTILALTGHFTSRAKRYYAAGNYLIDGTAYLSYNGLSEERPKGFVNLGVAQCAATPGGMISSLSIAEGIATKEYVDEELAKLRLELQS